MTGLRFACVSDTGPVRPRDEDNFWFFGNAMPAEHQSSELLEAEVALDEPFAVGLFDGMGGESYGEVASWAAASAFGERAEDGAWTEGSVRAALLAANEAVGREREKRRVQTMGTTATLLASPGGGRMIVGNVGDSPAYLFAGNEMRLLTRAHTDAGLLEELGIENRKPGLTQYLGMADEGLVLNPHIEEAELSPAGCVLLVSDGLTDALAEDDIAGVLSRPTSTAAKAARLRDLAFEHGATDNVTVVLCERPREGEPGYAAGASGPQAQTSK